VTTPNRSPRSPPGRSSLAKMFAGTISHVLFRNPIRKRIAQYPVGAWLVAKTLPEAARDLSKGRAAIWAGKTYDRPVR